MHHSFIALGLLLTTVGCHRASTSTSTSTEESRPTPSASLTRSAVGVVEPQADQVDAGAPSASAAPARGAPRPSPLIEAVRQWDEALRSRRREDLERVYADRVDFYGHSLSRAQVVTAKLSALEKAPDFSQQLDDLRIERRETERPEVLFEKRWVAGGKPGKVRARLSLQRGPSGWVVAQETDDPTEARFSSPIPYSEDCQDAALRLVTTTEEGQKHLMSRGPSGDYPPNSARFETDDWPRPRVAIQENNEEYRVTLAWFQVDVVALTVVEQLIPSGGQSPPLETQAEARAAVKASCKRTLRPR